ncbi:hypothetical protein D3C77_677770 [compost metagenome]
MLPNSRPARPPIIMPLNKLPPLKNPRPVDEVELLLPVLLFVLSVLDTPLSVVFLGVVV